jgi:hypothetical protein
VPRLTGAAGERLRLAIATTWDGEPAEASAVEVAFVEDGLMVEVEAPYAGDAPPPGPPGRADRLWQHEVVELFLAEANTRAARYFELELGPHGHWLALGFAGYRQRTSAAVAVAFSARITGARWSGTARVDAAELVRVIGEVGAANAYAIRGSPQRRYYAAHPVARGLYPGPDFHRLEHFASLP